jgi:hypothetical protein
VRLDEESAAALERLTAPGTTDSQAVRAALREAADRRARRSNLASEAQRLAADPVDRAELAELGALLESLAPDDPEL